MSNSAYKCPFCNQELLEGLPFCPHCGQKMLSQFSKEDLEKDPYKILQIDPNADPEVIEAAYKSLAKKYHPDNNTGLLSEERMKDINWAREILTDPVKRKEWDRKKTQDKPIPQPEPISYSGKKNRTHENQNKKYEAKDYIIGIGVILIVCMLFIFILYLFDQIDVSSSAVNPTKTPYSKPTVTRKPTNTPFATKQVGSPKVVKDKDKVWEILNTQNWHYLDELSEFDRSTGKFDEPNTEYYSARLSNEGYLFVDIAWCAVDETTLNQNLEHIKYAIEINGSEINYDYTVDYSLEYEKGEFPGFDGTMVCYGNGLLTYDWPMGNHDVKEILVFDKKINDGYDDYLPGEYVSQYSIEVVENVEMPETVTSNDLLCKDTKNMVGEIVSCKIPRAYCEYSPSTSGNPTFCTDARYPNQNFTLLVWESDWSDLDGQCIIVSGNVSLYNGKPQIEVSNRSQISSCP
jgi:hypothetical protein